jgi:hypothetical protein
LGSPELEYLNQTAKSFWNADLKTEADLAICIAQTGLVKQIRHFLNPNQTVPERGLN